MRNVKKRSGVAIAFALFTVATPVHADLPYIGEIRRVAFDFAPREWARCDGQLLPISEFDALFALIGTTYGGDGQQTFALPDLRGRMAVHTGNLAGNQVRIGEPGGSVLTTLTSAQMPAHGHTVSAVTTNGNTSSPAGAVPAAAPRTNRWTTAAANTVMAPGMVSSEGGAQAFDNREPYIGINHIIALSGVFPSRP